MARFATPTVRTSGLYRALVEQREVPDDGRPLNVPTWSLPDWARRHAPVRKIGTADIRPARAIVYVDDTIVWSDDDSMRLWLEEHDL